MNSTIDIIRGLIHDATLLDGIRKDFEEKTKSPRVDKKGIGFNYDSRFALFSVKITLDSWLGYYGSSGCSTLFSLFDRDMAASALVEYLNDHFDDVCTGMAEILKERAKSLATKAEQEAAETLKDLSDVTGRNMEVKYESAEND